MEIKWAVRKDKPTSPPSYLCEEQNKSKIKLFTFAEYD